MADPGLSGLGPRDRRRALRNRAARSRFLGSHPLAPLTDQELLRQSTQDVTRGTLPLTRQINREAAAGEQNIAGIAEALAKAQGGYQGQMKDIYSRARESLGALDTAQQGALGQTQGGGTLAGSLAQRLALSGAPGADLVGMTGAAAGAGFARGSAEVGALAQAQAAAEEYAAKLPQFARLAGLQGVNERAAAGRQSLQRVQAQIPGQITSALQSGRSLNYQKAVASQGFGLDVAKLSSQERLAGAAERGRNYREQAGNRSREQIAAANRRAANARAILAEGGRNSRARAAATRAGVGIDVPRSEQTGYVYDKKGRIVRWKRGPGKGKPIPWRRKLHGKESSTGGGGGGGVGSPKD